MKFQKLQKLQIAVFLMLAAALVIPYVFAGSGGSSSADPTSNQSAGDYNCITTWAWEITPVTGQPGSANISSTYANFQYWYTSFIWGDKWKKLSGGGFTARSQSIAANTYWNGSDNTWSVNDLLSGTNYRWKHYDWNITGVNIGDPWDHAEHTHPELRAN